MRGGARGVVVAVALAMSGCGAAALSRAQEGAELAFHAASVDADVAQREAAAVTAFSAARDRTAGALADLHPADDAFRRLALLDTARAGNLAAASLITWFWRPEPSDPDAFAAYVYVLTATGRSAEAQSLTWDAAVASETNRTRWIRLWYLAMASDADVFPEMAADVRRNDELAALEAFTGQSSIILKMTDSDGAFAVFKPHQVLRHQSYRGEVASYRLCRLIRCTFDIPLNREAWFEEAEFRSLLGVDENDDLRFGTHRRLVFVDEGGARVVYGVIKEWVPDFTRFPVEYADVWRPLVTVGVTADELRDLRLRDVLAPFADRPRGFYHRILDRSEGMTGYDLARQLSELHVFDLLINNFDRYQPEWFGMNAHWAQGGFVSIDNGASFSLPDEFGWRAVRSRARQVQVFSRSMIDAIRWMDTEAAFALLFPSNPHFEDEAARFDAFLGRRAWLLEYVDGLVDRYGEDAVYVFD